MYLFRHTDRRRLVLAASIALLVLAVAAWPAQASSRASARTLARPTLQHVSLPMRIVRFDRAVAAAHGFRVVTRNGVQMSVKRGATTTASAAPYNTLYGNCGYSYFYLSGGNNIYYFNTGFHVNTAAVDYDWHVDIDGPYGYDRDWYWGGGLAFRHDWSSGTRSSPVDDSGYYAGDVQNGLVILVNGGVCYTLHPSDRDYVY
jgi:hypothetical protein